MHEATRKIYEALRQHDNLKVFTEESDSGRSDVWLQFGVKNGSSYRIRFISNNEGRAVAVRIFSLIQVEEEQRGKILGALNELNCKYRFVKFCCDTDGDVNLEYDFLDSCEKPEESAYEIVLRMVRMVDDAYPVLMRALWA